MKVLTGLVLGAMIALASPAFAAHVGKPAPDFTLAAADGSTQSLSAFKGKTVILEWFNKDCPFVRKHYDSGNMQSLQKDAAEKDIVWLTINSSAPGKQGHEDAAQALATAQAEKSAAAHVLLDPTGETGRAYDAKTTPHMYIINAEGVLVYAGAIDDTPSFKQDDIVTSKNYVTQALAELAEGKPVSESTSKAYGCAVKYPE